MFAYALVGLMRLGCMNGACEAGLPAELVSILPADAQISATEAGRRYGEAAGAALVCYGLKLTPQFDKLRARFQGDDLGTFDSEARKIVAAWRKTQTCELAGGPNDCKISQQWSCRQAIQEVGPQGTAVPGLLEPK
jgi:hypothetical protein